MRSTAALFLVNSHLPRAQAMKSSSLIASTTYSAIYGLTESLLHANGLFRTAAAMRTVEGEAGLRLYLEGSGGVR